MFWVISEYQVKGVVGGGHPRPPPATVYWKTSLESARWIYPGGGKGRRVDHDEKVNTRKCL